MYTALGEQRLKTGETLALGVVECPAPDWAERIAPFLGHKPRDSREHIRRALEGPLDGLETRFYVGLIDGRVATEVMIVSARGVGILGHVFTLPEHRRKGAFSHLMQAQMGDMARAGIALLCLSTGFDTPPYWIYHSFGFRSIADGQGKMIWRADPDAEARLLRPGATHVRPVSWGDWPWFDLLGMQPVAADEVLPRTALLGLKGQGSLEGPFVPFMIRKEEDAATQGWVLESEVGATVGFALAAPDRCWYRDVWAADLHLLPGFRGRETALLDSVTWPDAPCVTYRCGPGAAPDEAAWRAAGFSPETVLPKWLVVDEARADLEMWVRWPGGAGNRP